MTISNGIDCKDLSNMLFKTYNLCHQIDGIVKNLTMNDRINRTSICCIVFLDVIDYSKKTDSEQIDVKNQFNNLINHSLKDIAQNDRIILDTGDGAAIAYMGSPEDALFMALTIRDGILKSNMHSLVPLYVRFGINLGPVRVVNDINGRLNIIGDGINVAQRIMSFAKPNQILVSRSYYEVTSRLTQEIAQMFVYSGVKHDKHVREHEVYSVRLRTEQIAADNRPAIMKYFLQLNKHSALINKVNWRYTASGLIMLAALFTVAELVSTPFEAVIASAKPVAVVTAAPASKPQSSLQETTEKDAEKDVPPRQAPLQADASENPQKVSKSAVPAAKPTAATAGKDKIQDKSALKTFTESIKHGSGHQCTQAEVILNQCR